MVYAQSLLISPYWNVNRCDSGICNCSVTAFNLSILECKWPHVSKQAPHAASLLISPYWNVNRVMWVALCSGLRTFNLSILECKYEDCEHCEFKDNPFNLSILECKLNLPLTAVSSA